MPLLSGCSWINELLVYNKTRSTLVVRFSNGYNLKGNSITSPDVYKISEWDKGVPSLGDTIHVYSRIENDTMRYVELPANCALVVARGSNLDLQIELQAKQLLQTLSNLEVLSANDTVFHCRGTTCYPEFDAVSKGRAGFIIQ